MVFRHDLHIGVDSQSGLTHSAVVTAANVHDKHPLPDLLHGAEQRVYGDSAYASQKELIGSKVSLFALFALFAQKFAPLDAQAGPVRQILHELVAAAGILALGPA